MNKFVVTPTRGINPALVDLNLSVRKSGATHIIVHPNHDAPVGLPTEESIEHAKTLTHTFEFEGSINIIRAAQNFQYWGNLGFRKALEVGGEDTIVLMINDDIVISPEELNSIFDQFGDADVLSMDDRPKGGATPMTGWLFGLRPSKILMDENYVFWWGDDDLWNRAETAGLKTTLAHAKYKHERKSKRDWDEIFDPIMKADKDLYQKTWIDVWLATH